MMSGGVAKRFLIRLTTGFNKEKRFFPWSGQQKIRNVKRDEDLIVMHSFIPAAASE